MDWEMMTSNPGTDTKLPFHNYLLKQCIFDINKCDALKAVDTRSHIFSSKKPPQINKCL